MPEDTVGVPPIGYRKEKNMNPTSIVSTPLKYLDKAVNSLRDLGLMPTKTEEAPISALIEQVSDLDEEKALAIARTLSHTTVFNEVVREQITQMKVGERYETITEAFNSIREDAKAMVDQLDDGKISTMERLQKPWKQTRVKTANRLPAWNWTGTSACANFRTKTNATRSSRTWPRTCRSVTTPPRS
jgi:hypothetical protein